MPRRACAAGESAWVTRSNRRSGTPAADATTSPAAGATTSPPAGATAPGAPTAAPAPGAPAPPVVTAAPAAPAPPAAPRRRSTTNPKPTAVTPRSAKSASQAATSSA